MVAGQDGYGVRRVQSELETTDCAATPDGHDQSGLAHEGGFVHRMQSAGNDCLAGVYGDGASDVGGVECADVGFVVAELRC